MNVVDMLKYGDGTFKGAYGNIPHESWERGEVTGYWSVKNIVAHLTSWELIVGDILVTMTGGGETPSLDELAAAPREYNEGSVVKRQNMTPAETQAEYEAAHARVMELAPKVSPETYRENGTIPWYGADYCLNDFIVYINYAHKREHAAEINLFRDRLEAEK